MGVKVDIRGPVGRRRASLESLCDDVVAIRRLLAGEAVPSGETSVRLRNHPDGRLPVLLTASGPRLLEQAGEVADGALMLVGLHPDSVAAAREHLRIGAHRAWRDPAELREIFIVPVAVGEAEAVREWPRRWFRPGQPWLEYPSRSNLRWLREAGLRLPESPEHIADDLAERICDAFGLFGGAEHCAERLIRAHEEAGIDHAFLFPAHTFETGYEMPRAEVEAFGRVIRPRLEA